MPGCGGYEGVWLGGAAPDRERANGSVRQPVSNRDRSIDPTQIIRGVPARAGWNWLFMGGPPEDGGPCPNCCWSGRKPAGDWIGAAPGRPFELGGPCTGGACPGYCPAGNPGRPLEPGWGCCGAPGGACPGYWPTGKPGRPLEPGGPCCCPGKLPGYPGRPLDPGGPCCCCCGYPPGCPGRPGNCCCCWAGDGCDSGCAGPVGSHVGGQSVSRVVWIQTMCTGQMDRNSLAPYCAPGLNAPGRGVDNTGHHVSTTQESIGRGRTL